jgi:trigger factor
VNITTEQVGDNHVRLLVNVEPVDYQAKVEEEIKSLSKKISMNGFRPGKVPPGLAKKFYGNTVLAEQLDKLLNSTVLDYIKQHELKILGQPMPFEVKHQHIDVYHQQPYDFGFELGLIPEFEIAPLESRTFENRVVNITDEMINEEVERVRSMHGPRTNPETVGEDDIITAAWTELNESGEPKENGITANSSFAVKIVKDDVSKQLVLNLKKDDTTDLNIRNAFGNDMELIIHNILKTDHEKADQMNDRFRLTVKNITHIDPAPIDQDLFDTAFGKDTVKSEEEMRERIRKDMSEEFRKVTVSRLDRDIREYMIDETPMQLPVEFLRKLINANKEEGQPDIDDHQMSVYVRQVKWDLISSRIARENNLEITTDDLKERTKNDIINYYGGVALFNENPESLDRLVGSLLSDEKHTDRMREQMMNDKLAGLLRRKAVTEDKIVDQHEFFHH